MSDCRECGRQAHKCVCEDATINRLIAAFDRMALPLQLPPLKNEKPAERPQPQLEKPRKR